MNTIYNTSDQASGQAVYAQVFARWSQVTGVRYVYESTTTDRLRRSGSSGVLGVRGDCRSPDRSRRCYNVLASTISRLQRGGDSVLTPTSLLRQHHHRSIRLRNVVAHEHATRWA